MNLARYYTAKTRGFRGRRAATVPQCPHCGARRNSYFLSYPPQRNLNANTPEALGKIIYRCLIVMEYGLPELEKDLVDFLHSD